MQSCRHLTNSAWQRCSTHTGNSWLHGGPQQLARVLQAAQRSAGVASTSGPSDGTEQQRATYTKRQRLDDYVVQQFPQYSKNLVQSWIAQGKVLINDKVCNVSVT